MANAFRFYFCGNCGSMNVRNLRDSHCPVCHVARNWKIVEVRGETELTLIVTETEAPHEEE
jgi:hypothetical protein